MIACFLGVLAQPHPQERGARLVVPPGTHGIGGEGLLPRELGGASAEAMKSLTRWFSGTENTCFLYDCIQWLVQMSVLCLGRWPHFSRLCL